MNELLPKIFVEYYLAGGNQASFERLKQDFQSMSTGVLERAFYAGKFKNLGLEPISLIQSCREIISLLPQTPPEFATLLEKFEPLSAKVQSQIQNNLKLHEFHYQPFASIILEKNCSQSSFIQAVQQIDIDFWRSLLQQLQSQSIYDRFYASTLETFLKLTEELLNLFSEKNPQKNKIIQGHQRSIRYLQRLRQRGEVMKEVGELLQKRIIGIYSYRELMTKNSLEFEKLLPSLIRTGDFDFLHEKKFLTLEEWKHLRARDAQTIHEDLKHRIGLLIGIKHSFENGEIPPTEVASFILQVIQTPKNEQLKKITHPKPVASQQFRQKVKQRLEQQQTKEPATKEEQTETRQEEDPNTKATPEHSEDSKKQTKIPQKYLKAIQDLLNPIREGIRRRKEIQTTGQAALDELNTNAVAFETSLTIAEKHMEDVMLLFHDRKQFQKELTILKKEALGHVQGDTQIFALEHTLIAYETPYKILPEELEHVQSPDTIFLEKDAWVTYIVHKYKLIHEAYRSDCNKSRLEALNLPQKNAILIFVMGQILNASPLFFDEADLLLFEEKLPKKTPQSIKNTKNVCLLLFQCGFSAELIKLLILSEIWSLDEQTQQQVVERLKAVFSQRYSKAANLPELEQLNPESLREQVQSISKDLLENIDEHGVTIHTKISQIANHQGGNFIKDILPYEWSYFKKSLLVTGYLLRFKGILDAVLEIENLLARRRQSEESHTSLSAACKRKILSIAKLSDCDQRLELMLDASSNYFDSNGEFFREGTDLYHQNTGFIFQ